MCIRKYMCMFKKSKSHAGSTRNWKNFLSWPFLPGVINQEFIAVTTRCGITVYAFLYVSTNRPIAKGVTQPLRSLSPLKADLHFIRFERRFFSHIFQGKTIYAVKKGPF